LQWNMKQPHSKVQYFLSYWIAQFEQICQKAVQAEI
jgi:hypothetical protein